MHHPNAPINAFVAFAALFRMNTEAGLKSGLFQKTQANSLRILGQAARAEAG